MSEKRRPLGEGWTISFDNVQKTVEEMVKALDALEERIGGNVSAVLLVNLVAFLIFRAHGTDANARIESLELFSREVRETLDLNDAAAARHERSGYDA